MKINEKLILPCGVSLKNRIAKSAMSENMGTRDHTPNQKFTQLYDRWAKGGSGLLISGNVMVDSSCLGEPHNIVIDSTFAEMEQLSQWAKAGTQNQTHLWMQINHPGKQSPKFLTRTPVAPSAVPFQSSLAKMFNPPRALLESEIELLIQAFAYAARVAKQAGFTGVQIHGAHGYLVSQFLSPLHNIREDRWGGSLENRMRFVTSIYQAMRAEVGAQFPISIKLNSADFQKGGFSEDESIIVAHQLSLAGMDLIEISGGTYESPAMTGSKSTQVKESTQKREAYFLEFCQKVRNVVKTPLMLTGGFRSLSGMEQALVSGACDVIGLARSVALNPEFPNQLLSGQDVESEVMPLTTGFKSLDKLFPLEIIWYTQQLHRMGKGHNPNPKASALATAIQSSLDLGVQSLRRVRG